MSVIPSTTLGCSVKRPTKSPYSEDSPAKVESPRLWYTVGSFSQAGTLAVLSASVRKIGLYGNDVAGSRAGKVPPPAYVLSSKAVPVASLYGLACLDT